MEKSSDMSLKGLVEFFKETKHHYITEEILTKLRKLQRAPEQYSAYDIIIALTIYWKS
jgi:hypothetical protein